jgi:hypothetical protein
MATAQFESAGLSAQVAFFDAIDGSLLKHAGAVSDGQAGCCMSHLAVLKAALAKGHRHVLVFEDDVQLVEDFTPRLDAALSRCPASYDLCYVGAICRASWGNFLYPFDDLLARAGSVCGTHAYIANLDCQAEIDANLSGGRNVIDNWYANQLQPQGNCYVCTPYLASQSSGFSDIAGGYNANGSNADYVWR